MSKITLNTLQRFKERGEKIVALTAYDATFAALLSRSGVEVLLVGDSLGMVVSGHKATVSVTLADMIYHTRCVVRGNQDALLIADLPFMTYSRPEIALDNAAQLIRAGAAVVKMEGGKWLTETVYRLTEQGIPVCGHLGLTPQSINSLGGYRVQAKTAAGQEQLIADALSLEEAGARLLVLECVPRDLAGEISRRLSIPVIGIGAGVKCDGQILVTYDMLGITAGKNFKFVKDFMAEQVREGREEEEVSIAAAIAGYCKAVKGGSFPDEDHSFS